MKTQALVTLTLTVLMSLSASAIGVVEAAKVRSVDDLRNRTSGLVHDGKDRVTRDAALREQTRQVVTNEFSQMSNGQISTREFADALNQNITMSEGGAQVKLDLVIVSQSIRDAKRALDGVNEGNLDANAKDMLAQQRRALEIAPKFISLASLVSDAGTNVNEMSAFAKQLSLIPEIMTSMDAASAKSHLDVMELAIENRLRNPELEGDQAYLQALKTKYPDKYAQKLAELNGCQRGMAL